MRAIGKIWNIFTVTANVRTAIVDRSMVQCKAFKGKFPEATFISSLSLLERYGTQGHKYV